MREFLGSFFLFFALLLLVQWQALGLLPYWDELGFYVPYAFTLWKNNFSLSLEYTNIQISHPPLFYIGLAGLAKIFGWSILLIRISALIVSAAFCSGVYALARLHSSKSISIAITLAFIFSPLFFSESILAHADLPMAMLATWALYATFQKRFWTASALLTLGVLSNATLLVLCPVFAFFFAKNFFTKKTFLKFVKNIFLFSLPIFFFFSCWALWSYSFQGFTIGGDPDPNHGERFFHHGIFPVLHRLLYRIMQIFFLDYRFLLLVPVLYIFSKKFYFNQKISLLHKNEERMVFALCFFEILFLAAFGVLLQRYFLVILPLPFILCAWYLQYWKEMEKKLAKITIACLLIFCVIEYAAWLSPPSPYSFFHYRNAYRNQVQLLEYSAKYLEVEYKKYEAENKLNSFYLLSAWPLNSALKYTFLGYVSNEIPIKEIPFTISDSTLQEWTAKPATYYLASIINLQTLEHLSMSAETFEKIKNKFQLNTCSTKTIGIWQGIYCK